MKETRTKIKAFIYAAIFLLFLAMSLFYINRLLKDKYNYLKYEEFYEEKESFDVLFFGSSRMLDGVHPMELWVDYGLTAYNMAQHSENTRVSYWQLKNAIEHNKPQVAVVDLSLLGGVIDGEDDSAMSYLHKSLDHMPISKLKYDAIKDVAEDIDVWEYLFPIAIYHNRWNSLERLDIYRNMSCRKGAESRMKVYPLQAVAWSSDGVYELTDTTENKIDDIIKLCEENGVQLIFTCMPTVEVAANPGLCEIMNYLEGYAEDLEIPLLNFAKNHSFLNYSTDFSDASHLNPSGAKKLTGEIGAFLIENYTFEEKSDATVKAWQQAQQDYMKTKRDELIAKCNEDNAVAYLMLLNDDDYCIEMKLNDESVIEKLEIAELLAELGMAETVVFETMEDAAVEVTVTLKETGELFHYAQMNN